MSHIYIPTLLFWENGHTWSGSLGQARFYLSPLRQEGQPPQIQAQLWRGPLTRELSQILDTVCFPMSDQGLEELAAWLEERADRLNGEEPKQPSPRTE